MGKSDSGNDWLEPVLREGLSRVQAPAELWDRVALPRAEARQASTCRPVWMLAAASALTASVLAVAWGYLPGNVGASSFGRQAEFRSSDVSDVRGWVRERTGLDIPLLAAPHSSIHMIGASVEESGGVELRYLVGDRVAVLLVSSSASGLPRHEHVARISTENATTVSWSRGREGYTLTVQDASAMAGACLMCHSNSTL